MSDRGIHPDLLEEEQQAPAPETPSPRRGRAARAAPQTQPPSEASAEPSPPPEAETEPASEAAPAEPPEWWAQVKDAKDPETALDLITKHMSKQDLEKNPVLQGWIGDAALRRMRGLQEREERDARQRQKREALANADYYGLGQLTAAEVQQQIQQSQTAEQFAPFMDAVAAYQSKQPPEVQQQVQGKTFGAGKTYQEGFVEYLEAVHEAAVSHRLNAVVEQEIKRREPALRKAWLSESNGAQPVPELDGGRASSSREITDEQVARMSLAEYDTYFDANGQPRPGVRVRLTRGISTRQR